MLDPIDNTLVDETESEVDFGVKVDADDAHIGASIGPVSVDLGHRWPSPAASTRASASRSPAPPARTPRRSPTSSRGGFDVTRHQRRVDCDGWRRDPVRRLPGLRQRRPAARVATSRSPARSAAARPAGRLLRHQHQGRAAQRPPEDPRRQAFKFDSLAEGLQQYLFYSETALRTASNDGEMPVVGKDLQAGADFMGKAREKLDAMLARRRPDDRGRRHDHAQGEAGRDGRRRRRYQRHRRQLHLHPHARAALTGADGDGEQRGGHRHDRVRLQGRVGLQGRQAGRARLDPLRPHRPRGDQRLDPVDREVQHRRRGRRSTPPPATGAPRGEGCRRDASGPSPRSGRSPTTPP